MQLGADLSKQLNKQILNHFNMHLGTGKQKKEALDHYGYQE